MRCAFRFGLWSLLATLGACECGQRVQQVAPELGLNDESVDFGLVAVGDTALQTVRLNALTSADIELKVTLDDNGEGAFSFPVAAPDVVPGSGFVDVRLAFSPPDAQVFAATLDIVTNDPDAGRGRRRVMLSGEGKRPQVAVSGGPVELSAIACPPSASSDRCRDTGAVTVENVGLVTLTLGEVALVARPDGALVPNLSLTKLVSRSQLAPGQKLEVPLQWRPAPAQGQPDEDARYEVLLRIPSNDTEQPVVDVPVSAYAAPNEAPRACIHVTSVTRLEYQAGSRTPLPVPVPVGEWWLEASPGVLQVRPGYTVTVSTQPASGDPCTYDPEGDAVTPAWTLASPPKSRASMSAQAATQSTFVIDAEGEYEVSLTVRDSLQLAGVAGLTVNAIPRDDLFVQLSWEPETPAVDLDLHLLADAGPRTDVDGVTEPYGPATLFCEQDAFVFNPQPNLFDERRVADDPRFLRDDQGSAGRLESISLVEAPEGSRFRVAVHYFAGNTQATPTLTFHLRGQAFGPFTLEEPLAQAGDVWLGATIEFPVDDDPDDELTPLPTVTPLDERLSGQTFGVVGPCY